MTPLPPPKMTGAGIELKVQIPATLITPFLDFLRVPYRYPGVSHETGGWVPFLHGHGSPFGSLPLYPPI